MRVPRHGQIRELSATRPSLVELVLDAGVAEVSPSASLSTLFSSLPSASALSLPSASPVTDPQLGGIGGAGGSTGLFQVLDGSGASGRSGAFGRFGGAGGLDRSSQNIAHGK